MSIERRTDVSVKQSQGHHIGATVLLGRTGDHESKMKTGIRSDFMEDSEWRGQHKAAWELNFRVGVEDCYQLYRLRLDITLVLVARHNS